MIDDLLRIVQVIGSTLEQHEGQLATLAEDRLLLVSQQDRDSARLQALLSMISELAFQMGLSEAHVEGRYAERVRYYHDLILQNRGDTAPNLAGLSDDRTQDEIPTEPRFRPLFPQA